MNPLFTIRAPALRPVKPLRGVWLWSWALAACLPFIAAAQPGTATQSPAVVCKRLNADNWVAREVSLADLGFTGPLVLGPPDSSRELYLPVPANVPLSDGEVTLNANYMRADGGRTTMLVSLGTYPVSSRAFALEKGDASMAVGLDGAPRSSGFVRLGLNWGTALGADWSCTDGRTPGDVLRIEPDSRFTHRYDSSAVRDSTTAWGALPSVPVILISGKNLTNEAYDSAWRIGLALECVGKRSKIAVLPSVGDTVDLTGIAVPTALRSLTAFAGLAQGGSYKLKDAAGVAP